MRPMNVRLCRLWHLLPITLLVVWVLLAAPTVTFAHPLGNFTVNRYSRLELGATTISLYYVLDMAEIPTFQERAQIDSDGNGTISQEEQTIYLQRKLSELAANLHLTVNGQPTALQAQEQQLAFPDGQGGLTTLRLNAGFVAQLPQQQGSWQVEYHDNNYEGRLGWQEVVVQAASGASLLESNVSSKDQSQELRVYPQDMLQSPLTVNSASFRFEPGVGSDNNEQPLAAAPASADRFSADPFAGLINLPVLGPTALLLTLLAAFGLGAMHALAPGHGKTVVAAYLVGSRGTAWHAVLLGLTTTVTHTAGVFALGIITLFVSRFILPEQLYPWLGVISGLLVVIIGVSLFGGRLRALLGKSPTVQDHTHSPGETHDQSHYHSHGSHSHTHPGADGGPISWRSLLVLGISGGLLPCPSALVVLLSAIALGRVGFGLLLIVAFSLGLASVLTAIGVLLVYAGRLFKRIPTKGRLIQALPAVSALVITIVGLGITVQALVQTGLLRI